MEVTYLYHSGVMIETKACQIFFDVTSDILSLVKKEKDKYFFVTHGHADHYDKDIFRYDSERTHYIFSDDIQYKDAEVKFVSPNHTYYIDNMKVSTYDSTDKGLAFLIELNDKIIFHAGDLNWWHWKSDDEMTQQNEAQAFQSIISQIHEKKIDLAFIPVDPRLEEASTWAAEYFINQFDVTRVIPIHFGHHYDVCQALKYKTSFPEKVVSITQKNQKLFEL